MPDSAEEFGPEALGEGKGFPILDDDAYKRKLSCKCRWMSTKDRMPEELGFQINNFSNGSTAALLGDSAYSTCFLHAVQQADATQLGLSSGQGPCQMK